ncbi:three component ABC system middle component [Promicromonospora sp. NPDC060271]|uniref:three component ABC system middle component n=1 Tax=Promicromonospora sp. NPDC060271 TaxID=3347089 RepID=UPI00364BD0D5
MPASLHSPERKPAISATMLNPALISAAIAWAATRYEQAAKEAMPWEYSFISVPLTLHQETRRALPRKVTAHLPKWINEHPTLIAGFAPRARRLVPHVREGVRFGLRTGLFVLVDEGRVSGRIPARVKLDRDSEMGEIVSSAAFTGAWLARAGVPTHVFTMFGVMP